MYSARYSSPLGSLLLAGDDGKLVGLWMEGQKYFRETAKADMVHGPELPVLRATMDWLDRYFAGERPAPSELPLAPEGSAFRKAVWELLLAIPYGEVTTYGEMAKVLASSPGRANMSGRAVGGAVAHNPIAIIIPCHRVVGADGSLTGYAGGILNKVRLLEHEGADMSRLHVPGRGLRQG